MPEDTPIRSPRFAASTEVTCWRARSTPRISRAIAPNTTASAHDSGRPVTVAKSSASAVSFPGDAAMVTCRVSNTSQSGTSSSWVPATERTVQLRSTRRSASGCR
jgi:hypothetical protein